MKSNASKLGGAYIGLSCLLWIFIFGLAWYSPERTIKNTVIVASILCFPMSLIPSIFWPDKWWWWGMALAGPFFWSLLMGIYDWSGESPGYVRFWGGTGLTFLAVSLFGGLIGKMLSKSRLIRKMRN
jgi:hypothetical protein